VTDWLHAQFRAVGALSLPPYKECLVKNRIYLSAHLARCTKWYWGCSVCTGSIRHHFIENICIRCV